MSDSQGPDKRRTVSPRVPPELDTQLVESAIYQSDSSLQLVVFRLQTNTETMGRQGWSQGGSVVAAWWWWCHN